jgi:hypothetical protein
MPNHLKTDVLVCGAGSAGVVAALAAARAGARTLVVDRAPFAGGIVTATGLPFFDGIAHAGTGQIVVKGIPIEIAIRMDLCREGDTHLDPHNPYMRSVEQFKLLTDELLTSHGNLQVLFHTSVCDVEAAGGRIKRVAIANKDGLGSVEAKQIIDTTGDADVAAWAGAEVAKSSPLMPMSMHFRVGHVRRQSQATVEHLSDAITTNPAEASISARAREHLILAQERGDLPMFYGPGIMFAFADDEAYIHAVRVSGDATDAADLTRAEMQGRKDAWTIFQVLKEHLPEFKEAYFISSGPYIGIRETRRLVGQLVLSEDDIARQRAFDDAIATGCWYLDVHPNKTTLASANEVARQQPEPYDIPYRALLPKGISNLIVAGRCHSATADAASSTRVNVTAMAMGQAAGTAAALAVEKDDDLGLLDGTEVRATLEMRGAGPYRQGR